MSGYIKLLDCTLRDGGYAVEHKLNKNIKVKTVSKKDQKNIIENLTKANIDVIEIGTVEKTKEDYTEISIYPSVQEIAKNISDFKDKESYAFFIRNADFPIEEIPEWNETLPRIARFCIRYSELEKSLLYCKLLKEKGYLVSIQPSVTVRYTKDEIYRTIEAANEIKAYALYYVDSYGYMTPKDVLDYYSEYNNRLDKSVVIGFHAHNNINMAAANVIELTEKAYQDQRNVVIDTCLIGMGQGTGNLQTECISNYFKENYGCNYDYISILAAAEIVGKLWEPNLWGYSVPNSISAIYKVAYGYALELEEEFNASYSDIAKVLKYTNEKQRYRFTRKDLDEIIKRAKDAGERIDL